MPQESLTSRVRRHLQRLRADRQLSQVDIAKRLDVDPSAISHTISKDDRPITLDFLEAVAATNPDIRIAELVAAPESVVKELNPDEAFIVRALQKWPASVVRSLRAFLAFYADEPPVEVQTRNMHEYWRRLTVEQRDWLYGVTVLLKEGSLPQDLRAGLVDRLQREQYRREADDAKRRR